MNPKELQPIPVIAKCDGIIITPAGTVFTCGEVDGHEGMHTSECKLVSWSAVCHCGECNACFHRLRRIDRMGQ